MLEVHRQNGASKNRFGNRKLRNASIITPLPVQNKKFIKEKKMKTKTHTFATALIIMMILAIGSSMAFGQNKADQQETASYIEDQGNTLVGVWESVGSVTSDCQTGEPTGPVIRALYSF